jgi:hypothetical protein
VGQRQRAGARLGRGGWRCFRLSRPGPRQFWRWGCTASTCSAHPPARWPTLRSGARRWPASFAATAAASLLAGLAAAAARSRTGPGAAAVAIAAWALAALSFALFGHAATALPQWLTAPAIAPSRRRLRVLDRCGSSPEAGSASTSWACAKTGPPARSAPIRPRRASARIGIPAGSVPAGGRQQLGAQARRRLLARVGPGS